MLKIKKWQAWLIVAITLAIAIALICINLYVTQKTVIIIFLVIDFLIMTFSLNTAISLSIKFKPKPKKYPSKSFNFNPSIMMDNLIKNGFKENKAIYGNVYLKIADKTAYKVIVITDIEAYLNPNEQNNQKSSNLNLKNCTRFIGQEIFLQYNDKALQTLPDFSFQGKNIYYEAYYYDNENNILIEPNAITASIEFSDDVKKMKEDYLGLKENINENSDN